MHPSCLEKTYFQIKVNKSVKVCTQEGIGLCNKFPELAVSPQNLVVGTKNFVLATSPSDWLVKTLRVNCSWDKSQHQIKINQSQIGNTSPHNSYEQITRKTMLGASLPPECWSTFTKKKIDNSGTKLMKITAIKTQPTKKIKCFLFLYRPHLIGNKALFFACIRTKSEKIQALNNFAEQSAVCTELIYFNAILLF